jgi:hypothetical protein
LDPDFTKAEAGEMDRLTLHKAEQPKGDQNRSKAQAISKRRSFHEEPEMVLKTRQHQRRIKEVERREDK